MATESRRRVARALHGVFGRGARVPDAWDQGLGREDAAFAQALLGLCLRRWGRLQAWVRPRLTRPDRGIPLGSEVALALGLAQLAWMDGVTDHAAVHETVTLAGDAQLGFPPHRGLVNAILRAAARNRLTLRAELEALPAQLDRPPFAERALAAALAPHGAGESLEALWARLQNPPRPCFRALDADPLPEGLEPHPALAGALRLGAGAPFPWAWLASGSGMVQDLSSQALLAFPWSGTPQRILDACAAPGGKTTALARRWPDAEIVALESDPVRAERLRENLVLRRVAAQIRVEDAEAWMRKDGGPFDLILVDAPCSGSGTLQKHPELAWIGDRIDLPRLRRVQASLVDAALGQLAPGGLLIYAVCSWLPEEGLAHREELLRRETLRPLALWPPHLGPAAPEVFAPNPLTWDGEGFQAFAFQRVR